MTKSRTAILGVLTLYAFGAVAEQLASYDHRNGNTDDGYYLLFTARSDEEGSFNGDAFVVVATGTDSDALVPVSAYGLFDNEGTPDVGLVTVEHVAAARAAADTKTLAVQVSEEHHAIAKGLIAEWAERDDFLDEPDVVALNFCETLLGRIKMKKPFRPILSRANPHVYYADITALNRNRAPKE